ncbi:sugar transporter ERD6-like 6 [Humulus lupulus]|uniref:sugar transporter ERD6-like 6 n=1 Tax=Humulus lupulus TaxID=3486 RepID=UPI002B4037D6|nr:sugar transporter ERD6-like 6 [Humulus lupulus]
MESMVESSTSIAGESHETEPETVMESMEEDETRQPSTEEGETMPVLESSNRAEVPRSCFVVLRFVIIIASCSIQTGFTGGYTSPTQSAIIKDLNLTPKDFSSFGSLSNLGAMCGAIASCLIAKYIGRRSSLMIAAIPSIIGWVAISFAEDSTFLFMGRLLGGFGVGIISYTVPVYIAEIAPQNMRGTLGAVNQLSVTIGVMLAYLLGMFVPWKVLAALGIVPFIILIPGLCLIPESPRWLAKMGMTEAFESSLQALRGSDTDITLEVNDIMRTVASSASRQNAFTFADFKRRSYWFPSMIGIVLLVLQQLSGINGILFYSTKIFENAGISSSNVATFGLGVVQVLATGVATWLLDKAGRRLLLIVSSVGMTIGLLVVAVSFYKEVGGMGVLSLAGLVAVVIFFSLGLGPIPWIIMSEILPVNIKGPAGSAATFVNWLTSWGITFTANLLLNWSSGATFTIYTVVSAFTVVFALLWVPETKGRTLEEIQQSFS